MQFNSAQFEQEKQIFLQNFKLYCQKQKWTHKRIAEQLGCSRSYISKIFTKTRSPSIALLEKMELLYNETNGRKN